MCHQDLPLEMKNFIHQIMIVLTEGLNCQLLIEKYLPVRLLRSLLGIHYTIHFPLMLILEAP